MNPIRVVQYGLGPIGLECARTVLAKHTTHLIQMVGAIDIDPAKAGRDLADLLGLPDKSGIIVSPDADAVLAATKPDVVLHTTSSFLANMYTQLTGCVQHGAHVVSSTEELSYPYQRHPEISAILDAAAKAAGKVILGTGVNPGYAMDALALMATGVCNEVSRIEVQRVVDAGKRRLPLQLKVGAGLTPEAFAARKATGTFGHIGLRESLLMVADGLGWRLDTVEETLDPVMADVDVMTPYLTVERGQVAGIHHAITGAINGDTVLSLNLKMYVGAQDPRDAVHVEGNPPIDLVIRGGIFGDTATVATLINAVPIVLQCPPGLKTVKDVPLPRAFATPLAGRG
jgi:4-hydroxy-tetrahydrodipicolinate reductase